MVKNILFLFLLIFSTFSMGQVNFYEAYNSNGYDQGFGVVELVDSSYIICGATTSFQSDAPQAFLMKIDSLGQQVWTKHYGGEETEIAKRIFHTPNVGFFSAGHMNTTANNDFNFYFFHTDESGNVIWEKNYGTSEWDILNDAIKFTDSSYLLIGETNNPTDGEKDGYMVRLDQNGDTLWTQRTNLLGEDVYNGVVNYNDTAFAIGGKEWNADSSMYKAFISVHRAMDGSVIWHKQYGDSGNYEIKDVEKYNGDILSVGNRISTITGYPNDYANHVNSNGDVIYNYAYFYNGIRSYDHIAKYGSSNHYYIDITYDDQLSGNEEQNVIIGDFLFNLVFLGSSVPVFGKYEDVVGEIIGTSDGGAIIVGTKNNIVEQTPSVFVMKIGPNNDFPNTVNPLLVPQSLVAIEEVELNIKSSIYPNPAMHEVFVGLEASSNGNILISSLNGQLVKSIETQNNTTKIDTSDLDKGVYLVEFKVVNGPRVVLGKLAIK